MSELTCLISRIKLCVSVTSPTADSFLSFHPSKQLILVLFTMMAGADFPAASVAPSSGASGSNTHHNHKKDKQDKGAAKSSHKEGKHTEDV